MPGAGRGDVPVWRDRTCRIGKPVHLDPVFRHLSLSLFRTAPRNFEDGSRVDEGSGSVTASTNGGVGKETKGLEP